MLQKVSAPKTDILIYGEDAGSKLNKAQKLKESGKNPGIQLMDETTLNNELGGS